MNHSEHLAGLRISYWTADGKNLIASDKENADTVHVGDNYPSFVFKLPEQKFEFEKLCHALENAMAVGDAKARRDIRNCLGIKE